MTSHGHCTKHKWSRTYTAWANMVKRCRSNHPRHHRYADRGIAVCKRWLKFENFLADMGEAPEGLTLDRINNERGYSRSNCRWTTYLVQNRNSHYLTFNGVTRPIREWELALGFKAGRCTIQRRLKLGWSLERALTEPRNNTGRR